MMKKNLFVRLALTASFLTTFGLTYSLQAQTLESQQSLEIQKLNHEVLHPMFALQIMLETYAHTHQGHYPANLSELYQAAQKEGYWLNQKQSTVKVPVAYMDAPQSAKVKEGNPATVYPVQPGMFAYGFVYYQPVYQGQKVLNYKILRANSQGLLLAHKGKVLSMTKQMDPEVFLSLAKM